MKKILAIILTVVFILSLPSCGSKNAESGFALDKSTVIQNSIDENNWTEQDIISMFYRGREIDWEYIDCVLISDYASNCVGAVLFRDNGEKTSNVAFYNADGYCQQCGTFAKMAVEPDFTYLGDGTVTFKLEMEDAAVYNFILTISIDGSNVNFIAEDDFSKA